MNINSMITIEESKESIETLSSYFPARIGYVFSKFDEYYKIYCNKKRWNRLPARKRRHYEVIMLSCGLYAKRAVAPSERPFR